MRPPSGHLRTIWLAALCAASLGASAARADITAPCLNGAAEIAPYAGLLLADGWQSDTDAGALAAAVRQTVTVFGMYRMRPQLETEAEVAAFVAWVDANLAGMEAQFLQDAALFRRGEDRALLVRTQHDPGNYDIMCAFLADAMPDADAALSDRFAPPGYPWHVYAMIPVDLPDASRAVVDWARFDAPAGAGLPRYAAIVVKRFRDFHAK